MASYSTRFYIKSIVDIYNKMQNTFYNFVYTRVLRFQQASVRLKIDYGENLQKVSELKKIKYITSSDCSTLQYYM